MSATNHAETIERLTLANVRENQVIKLDDGRLFAFVASGNGSFNLEDVSQGHALPPPLPTFVRQTVTLQDEKSMVVYANRFKNDNSALFGDIGTNTILAVIDYHRQPAANVPMPPSTEPNSGNTAAMVDAVIKPRAELGAHTAKLVLPKSQEWLTWTGIDGKMMQQLEFVRFLEENAPDIIDPVTADLIEVCRDMQALRKVQFQKVVRAASNNAETFEYTDDTKANAKGGVEIPTQFTLDIPVYFNGVNCNVKAFLRWHLDDGDLKLGIKLYRPENIRQATFKETMEGIAAETGLTTLYGEPGNLYPASHRS